MNEERRRILSMLAEGKISAAEAESLLDAMNGASSTNPDQAQSPGRPKYARRLNFPNPTRISPRLDARSKVAHVESSRRSISPTPFRRSPRMA